MQSAVVILAPQALGVLLNKYSREVKRTKLPDIHDIILIFQNSRLVVVHIKVIGRRKDSHDARESSCLGLPIHPVPCILCLMRTDDRQKVVLFEERASSGI